MFKRLMLAFTLFTLVGMAVAQNPRLRQASKPDPAAEKAALEAQLAHKGTSPDATESCSYTFTTGTGQNYLQSCVTVNGNIVEFQSPAGYESIGVGTYGEGYGLCDENTSTAYYDYAGYGDSGNWLPATLVSHTATSAKIARTTSDGIWTLTQTITQVAGTASVKVAMALKNDSAVTRKAYLLRFVDADVDNEFSNNNFGATYESAFAYEYDGYGLVMQSVAPWTYLDYGWVTDSYGPNPCAPNNYVPPVTGDYGMYLEYYFSSIPKNATKSVALTYKAF